MIKFVTNQKEIQGYDDKIVMSTVSECLEFLSGLDIIGVDTETNGFDPHTCDLLLLQMGNYEVQYVIDCTTVDPKIFKEILETKLILLHNAKFDLRFLFKYDIIPYRNIYDTFLAETLLYLGIQSHQKSYAACTKRYCKKILRKDIRGQIHKLGPYNSRVIEYSADDVKYLIQIRENQLELAKEKNLLNTLSFENVFVTVLAYVEWCGIGLDVEGWKKKSEADEAEMLKLKEMLDSELQKLAFPEFLKPPDLFNTEPTAYINWNSPDQVSKLFTKLGLDLTVVDKKTQKEKLSIEAKVIKPQKDKHPIIPIYLKYKEAQKLVTTYGYDFLKHLNPNTGRIHTNFTQNVSTGRLSSGREDSTKFIPGVVNLQNIPSGKERTYFSAEKDKTLVVADYSG